MIIEYLIQYLPTLIALVSECFIVKFAIKILKEAKESSEYKKVIEQNKTLVSELREAKKLNKELLTKIDRIARGE